MDLMDFINFTNLVVYNIFRIFCGMYIIKTITYTLLFLSCFASCKTKQEELPLVIPEPGTLEKIEQRGVLNVCSYYNTTDYYVYKGIPKGFHYELVKDFADYLGVKLNIEINTNIDESLQKLNEGQYDLDRHEPLCHGFPKRRRAIQPSPVYHQSSTRSTHVGHASPIGR